MNDDLTILASAYLDGAATADERARVEADPELLREVERLRRVRAVLGDAEPPAISMRERHLAAALDAWDRIPTPERAGALREATPTGMTAAAAGAAAVTAPTSLDARRRSRTSRRILAVAAGLVVVLAGGLVARDALRTTDDDVAESDSAATAEPVETDAPAELDVAAADEAGDGGGAEQAPPVTLVIAEDIAQSDTFLGSDEAPPDDEFTVLTSLEDLAVYADFLVRRAPTEVAQDTDAPASGVPDAFPLCSVDRIVGPALWDAEGLFDVVVVVGIDDARGEAVAYEPETCNVVARTPLLNP